MAMATKNTSQAESEPGDWSLVDMLAILVRRWKLIVAGSISVILFAILVNFLIPSRYVASMLIEVGQIKIGNAYTHVERPDDAGRRTRTLAVTHAEQSVTKGIASSISVGRDFSVGSDTSGILSVAVWAKNAKEGTDFLRSVANKLIDNHNRILHRERQLIEEEIAIRENNIQLYTNLQKSLLRRQKAIKTQIGYLRSKLKNGQARLGEMMNIKVRISSGGVGDPIALVRINSEILRTQRYLVKIKEQFSFTLPTDLEQLEVEIESAQNRRAISSVELRGLKLALEDMIETSIISGPTVSSRPISRNALVITVLVLAVGFVLVLLAAFLTDFVRRNRAQIFQSI